MFQKAKRGARTLLEVRDEVLDLLEVLGEVFVGLALLFHLGRISGVAIISFSVRVYLIFKNALKLVFKFSFNFHRADASRKRSSSKSTPGMRALCQN